MNRKIKVVYLIPALSPSGFGRQLVELLTGLDKSRLDPVLVVFDRAIHYRELFEVPGVRIFSLDRSGARKWRFPFRLYSLLREERPDILHSFQLGANKWARIIGVPAGIKNIITSIRNTNLKTKWIVIERILYRFGKIVIVNSEAIERELAARIRGIRPKLAVIHNGVDTDRFKAVSASAAAEAKGKLGFAAGDFVIAHIGGASRRKNPLALLDALRLLHDSGSLPGNLKVLFVGMTSKKSDEKRLTDRIGAGPFGDRCRLMEPVKDVESVYQAIDLLVLPSLWEGLPNVVLEAMACEKTVIVSEGANNCGAVEDGVNGWVYPTEDLNRLAELIRRAAASPAAGRSELGKRARGTILSKFGRERMVEETVKIYDSMMAAGSEKP